MSAKFRSWKIGGLYTPACNDVDTEEFPCCRKDASGWVYIGAEEEQESYIKAERGEIILVIALKGEQSRYRAIGLIREQLVFVFPDEAIEI